MFSADEQDAVETHSPGSPIIRSSSSSSAHIPAALKKRHSLLSSDDSDAMHNVQAVEHAMADLATSDGTFDIPLHSPTVQPSHSDGHTQHEADDQQQQQRHEQQQREEKQADAVAQQDSHPPSRRIQAVGVPSELRDEEVRGIFDRFGSIQSVQLSSDVVAGKHSAIIEYADEVSATDAIQLDGFELNGSKLQLMYAPAVLQLDSSMLSVESVDPLPTAQQSAPQPVSASMPIAQPLSFPRPSASNVAIPIAAPVAIPASASAAANAAPNPAPTVDNNSTSTASASAAPVPASASSSASSSTASMPIARPAPTDLILHSTEFVNFKAHIPLTRIATSATQSWSYYEIGSKSITPLILLHGSSGTPAVYYQQLLALSSRGYRVISASWPPYWTVKEWVDGFLAFLDAMHIERAHVFGASLGGMLALQFATEHPSRVDSLILCNAFVDTLPFVKSALWTQSLYFMPEFVVKEVMLQSFPAVSFYADTIDFVVTQLHTLTAGDVASRLTLNSTQHVVGKLERIDQSRVLLILPQDEVTLPEQQKERLLLALPDAKQAMMKEGGDFPFISTADEVNLHLMVHLRGMGCQPQPVEDERAERDRQQEATAEKLSSPRAVDAVRETDSVGRAAMPLFRPAQSAMAGGASVASAYDAIAEQVEDERALEVVQQNNTAAAHLAATAPAAATPQQHFTRQVSGPSLTHQTLGDTIIRQAREEEEERARQRREREDSLRLQTEVEARLREIRERKEEERRMRLHEETVLHLEAERRKDLKSREAMAQLGIDGEAANDKPTRSYKRTSIFDE